MVGLMTFLKFSILLLSSTLFGGEIYILSYKLVTKGNRVSAESLYISSPMVEKRYTPIRSLKVEASRFDNDRYVIQKNRDEILEFLFKSGISIRDFSRNIGMAGNSQTTLLLPPLYIALDRVSIGNFITLLEVK
jgi:hypothetical protein